MTPPPAGKGTRHYRTVSGDVSRRESRDGCEAAVFKKRAPKGAPFERLTLGRRPAAPLIRWTGRRVLMSSS